MSKIILSLGLALVFLSCDSKKPSQTSTENPTTSVEKPSTPIKEIVFSPFSEIPDEVSGCTCVLYRDEAARNQRQYLFATNQGSIDDKNTAYAMINDVLEKIIETSTSKSEDKMRTITYNNEKYDIIVMLKEVNAESEESWNQTGTITIKDKAGNCVKSPVVGVCGC